MQDARLKRWFSAEKIKLMKEAIEDHRASASHAPRSLYGKIIAEADRDIVPEVVFRRTVEFGLANYPELDYEGEEMASVKGRALFVYTDGLNEAEDMEQNQFGDDHLLEILRNTHFESARQVVETLYAEVQTHRNGAEPNDDLTMMCLRVS